MCCCTPGIRAPFCGKPGCEWPAQREEYRGAKPLTNHAFAAYAARLAHKSASWAADTLQTLPEDILNPIRADVAARYFGEMRGLLDHMEQQVKRP